MKKRMLTAMLATSIILAPVVISAMLEQPAPAAAKAPAKKKGKDLNIIQKIRIYGPLLKSLKEVGNVFLELAGMSEVATAIDLLVKPSEDFMNEMEKEHPDVNLLIKYASQTQAAGPLLNEAMKKAAKKIAKLLKPLTPIVTGPLKALGWRTVEKKYYEENEKGELVLRVDKIPLDKVAKEIPSILVEKIFKLVNAYQKIVQSLLEGYVKTAELVKARKEETILRIRMEELKESTAPEELAELVKIETRLAELKKIQQQSGIKKEEEELDKLEERLRELREAPVLKPEKKPVISPGLPVQQPVEEFLEQPVAAPVA